jgi:hypothetical protein
MTKNSSNSMDSLYLGQNACEIMSGKSWVIRISLCCSRFKKTSSQSNENYCKRRTQ